MKNKLLIAFGISLCLQVQAQNLHIATTTPGGAWDELETKIPLLKCKKVRAELEALETAIGVDLTQNKRLARIDCRKFKNAKDTL